ncbi:unnamed protein product [Linum tenue]|uniref:Transmembrane protein n=1 Tax=Linum tenue TaxID=586396 RepID=A0AAV0QLE6_9ROSI|nr:unnamed protein product [Linum tenue]
MPLPWKKPKVSAISRIVADLPSPKHGHSLVVQTGFPTSLVDLFWKNHDRIKKPYSKLMKKHHHNQNQLQDQLLNEPETHLCDFFESDEFSGSSVVEEIQQEAEFPAAGETQSCHKDKHKRKMMKKLVPKQLRHRKKGKHVEEIVVTEFSGRREGSKLKRSGGEPFGHHRKGKLLILDVLTEQVNEECEVGMDQRVHGKEGKGLDSELLEEGKSETLVAIEEQREIKKKSKLSWLVILLAVLVGLAGGRILALLLAVASCLMLKLVVGRRKNRVNDKALKGSSASFSK